MNVFARIGPLAVLAAIGLFVAGLSGSFAGAANGFEQRIPMLAADSTLGGSPTPSPPPVQTATPTATPTNSPTAVPTATLDCAVGSVCVVRSSLYTSSTGTIHVVGEVVNGRSAAIGLVEITADFYSASGALLATDFTFADVRSLAAGGSSPFDLLLLNPPAGVVSFEIRVSDYLSPPATPPATNLDATITNTFTSSTGSLHLVGAVRNNSSVTYEFVEILVALYRADGAVVRTDFTFATPDTLGPGESGTFDILVLSPVPVYVSYKIWTDANATTAAPPASQFSVENDSSYVSTSGTLHVVGEVRNSGSSSAQFVEITANFYGAGGALLTTDYTFSDVSVLGPGQDSPFDVLVFDPPAGIVSYTVSVTDFSAPASSPVVTGLNATVTNTYTSAGGTLHIVGTVTNTSATAYEYVQPIVALYNAIGAVVAVDYTFTSPTDLAPGSTGTFDILMFDPPPYASTRLWVDAQ